MTTLLFRDDAYLQTCTATVTAVHAGGFETDQTVFYPNGGGQPGDAGVLIRADGSRIAIADTRKGEGIDRVVHIPAPDVPALNVGEAVTLQLDWSRRYAHMRVHTALHVLSCVVVAPAGHGWQHQRGERPA
jgi:misacylated tRNA(Ala) deacylase